MQYSIKDIALTGNATAQLHLGLRVQDDIESAAWLQKSVDNGNLLALSVLADRYETGKGVKKDLQKAVDLYRKAAFQGTAWEHTWPQWRLARLYESGVGVPNDYVLAYMWYNIAAAASHPLAIEFRDLLESEMTSAQIEKAQRLSNEFMAKHAKQ